MKIDFAPLFNIGSNAIASKTPTEATKENSPYKHPIKNKSGTEGQINRNKAITELQKELNNRNKDIERAKQVYEVYQENIKKSEKLRTEILKGVRAGQDIIPLFLKAVETISLMASDVAFYNQIKDDIKEIYGEIFLQKEPLQIELQETEQRLEKLQEAQKRERSGTVNQKLNNAIRQHRERIEQIKAIL
jgi:hypothetical protein